MDADWSYEAVACELVRMSVDSLAARRLTCHFSFRLPTSTDSGSEMNMGHANSWPSGPSSRRNSPRKSAHQKHPAATVRQTLTMQRTFIQHM